MESEVSPAIQYPTGLLKTPEGRYHTISFRAAPRPSDDLISGFCRYKSIGHHTVCFDTLELAMEWMGKHKEIVDMDCTWEWDGVTVPAIILDLPYPFKKIGD